MTELLIPQKVLELGPHTKKCTFPTNVIDFQVCARTKISGSRPPSGHINVYQRGVQVYVLFVWTNKYASNGTPVFSSPVGRQMLLSKTGGAISQVDALHKGFHFRCLELDMAFMQGRGGGRDVGGEEDGV